MESDHVNENDWMEEVVEIPIEDVLDLHTFRPGDVKILLQEYFTAAAEKGFESVRIIHGKGIGVLRKITISVCDKHACVSRWEAADEGRGGWGATLVYLKKLHKS